VHEATTKCFVHVKKKNNKNKQAKKQTKKLLLIHIKVVHSAFYTIRSVGSELTSDKINGMGLPVCKLLSLLPIAT